MKTYDSVFKSYDIRSIYQEPLDENFCWSLGKSLGDYLVGKHGEDASCVVGCDARIPNYDLLVALVAGLEAGGCRDWVVMGKEVASAEGQQHPWGVCSTSLIYWTAFEQFDCGISMTASHNPTEWVGMKICDRDASLFPSAELKAMIPAYEEFPYHDNDIFKDVVIKHCIDWMHVPDRRVEKKIAAYYDELLLPVYASITHPWSIVVDYSGGAGTGYEQAFFARLAEDAEIEVMHRNNDADGTFREHLSDTSIKENYEKVGAIVRKAKADLGVMFDGDADRLGVVDNGGEMVLGDRLLTILGASIVKQHKGATIVYDITSTNDIKENVTKLGGKAVPSRMGYRFVKAIMKEQQALFGGESSGHLLFPETGYAESPLLALGQILLYADSFKSLNKTLSSLISREKLPLKNYHVEDTDGIIAHIIETYADQDQDSTDGIRINGLDRWFLVRKSNSEPLLRLFVEAKSSEKAEEVLMEVEQLITAY